MKSLIPVIFLLTISHVYAQQFSDTLDRGTNFIRFNPLNLTDVSEPNISFGAERRITDNISLALDAGYIVYSNRFHDLGRSSGFIVRPAVRYFPNKSRIFFEGELHYKQATHHLHDWIGREVAG